MLVQFSDLWYHYGMARERIWPTLENSTLAEVNATMRCARSLRSHDRLLAIRTFSLGYSHEQIAAIFNISVRTVQRWVKLFNAAGVDGLIERPRSGRPLAISAEKAAEFKCLIDHPQLAGQLHWTARKFHGYVRRELDTELGYSTLVRWLHGENYRLKVPQPWPDRQDEEQRAAWRRELQEFLADAEVELWYADEMGVEGDPRPRRRWAPKGERTRVTRNGWHLRMNVCGMVCPRTGEFFALEFSHSNRAAFQAFLEEASRAITVERKRNILIVDNASWHKSATLDWGVFEPRYLPAYSPDLNPIEKLWMVLKGEWFTDFVAKNMEQLVERLDQALLWTMERSTDNRRTCAITTGI